MDSVDFERLQDFVTKASQSGTINYDWGCEIYGVESDHVCVRCFSTDIGDTDLQMELSLTGKLSIHSDGLMAWSTVDGEEPVLFSGFPWVFVAITYASP